MATLTVTNDPYRPAGFVGPILPPKVVVAKPKAQPNIKVAPKAFTPSVKVTVSDKQKSEAERIVTQQKQGFFTPAPKTRVRDVVREIASIPSNLGKKATDATLNFLEPVGERFGSAVRSIQTKSLTPLKESWEAQKKRTFVQPGDTPEQQISKLTNLALIASVDAGHKGFKKPSASPKPIEPQIKPQKAFTKDEITYNVDRLKISTKAKADLKAEIQTVGKKVEEVVGKKLTNNEVVELANNTSRTLNRTVKREETARKIATNLNLRRKIAEAAESGKIDGDFIDLWMKDKSAGEDIARQLQARRINADPDELNSINTILDSIYKVNKNADEVIKAAKDVDFNNAQQVTEFYRSFVKPKAREWVDLLRYNSMLSSPNTHMVNAFSNLQGSAFIAPVEKTVAGLVDATRAALTGGKRQYAIGEGGAYLGGYIKNLRQAKTNFVDVMRGKAFNKNPDVRSIPLTSGKFGRNMGRTVERLLDPPMRILEATDQFFTALSKGGESAALNYRAGKGIGVKNIEGQANKAAAKRLFRSELNLKEQGHVLNAIDDLTGKIEMLRHSDNPITSTIAKFTLPFIRTPMNIFKQGIEYSPLGLSTLPGASNKTEQVAKMLIGSASALGAATLLGEDRLTWAEPTNAKRKAQFREAGRQPYSVKVGNKWYSYSKLHPAVAFNFALVAAIDDAQKNKKLSDDEAETVLTMFAKYGQFLADQSYMKNIGDFVAGAKGDAGGFARQLANYPSQVIPYRAMLSFIERITDPVQRQPDPDGTLLEKQMQYMIAQIPGLAQKVPARLGTSGQPIPNETAQGSVFGRVMKGLNPIRTSTVNPEAESQLQKSLSLGKVAEKDRLENEGKKAKAQEIYDQIKNLSKEERKQRVLDLKSKGEIDEETVKKYQEIVRVDKLGLTPYEAELKSASVDSRVEILYEEMSRMSKEERTAYRKELRKKKILTDEVDSKLRKKFK